MSSILRKIERNKIKQNYGNNKIQKAWRQKQVNEYGIQGYIDMHNKNCKDKIDTKTLF